MRVDRDARRGQRGQVTARGSDGDLQLAGQLGGGDPSPDVASAAAWYTELFGIEPYFVSEADGAPAYIEYRIGDYQHEFGILSRRFAPYARPDPAHPGTVLTYWAVDDVQASLDRLLSLGATVHEEPIERGPGFVTASVIDPFGNLLGVMYNQHYLDILAARAGK